MLMNVRTITEEYIKNRLSQGIRDDGRSPTDYRNLQILTNTMPNAEGSAEVNLGFTKVLTGIKIDIADPMKDKPDEGNLTTSAELLPLASENYDVGPPTPDGIEVARVIDRGIRHSGILDLEKLFIEEGKVWGVYIDVYVLNYDGNLFDAGTFASVAALLTAKMPRYEDGKVVRENMGRLETYNVPTSCTFAKIAGSIVLDPDGNEEAFAKARLTIANDEKYIRAMQKGFSGSFKASEVDKMIDMAFEKSKDQRAIIKRAAGE